MRHTLPLTPQFYVTAPQPCPYLDGRVERKLFTALGGDHASTLNDALSRQGFRRSQNVLYRPSCADCAACLSARIRLADFKLSRNQKRVLKRNAGLERETNSAWATEEQFEVFRKYLDARHADGGMADMDIFEFAAMIEETPVRSRVIEYYDHDGDGQRRLVAACLTDVLSDGLSMVYSFFDPAYADRSMGAFMILDHIQLARDAGLPFVYLGYWVQGSPKMGYKAKYRPLEVYSAGAWRDIDALGGQDKNDPHPLSTEPISEQVANISLPDRLPTA